MQRIELELQNQELRGAQDALTAALARYTELFDFAPAGYFDLTEDGTIRLVNFSGAALVGQERETLAGRRFGLLVAEADRQAFSDFLARVFASRTAQTCELRLGEMGGAARVAHLEATLAPDAATCRVVAVDLSERRAAEEKLHRLTRLSAVRSQINQAIIRARGAGELFRAICRVAVDVGRFRMAWIGLVDEGDDRVKPVARAGVEDGYLDLVPVPTGGGATSEGPTGLALRRGELRICQDIATDPGMQPWRDEALKRGYRSSSAVAFRRQGKPCGAFSLYAAEPDFFTPDEKTLLAEIGDDISYALDALAASSESRRVKEALRASERRYHDLFYHLPDPVFLLSTDPAELGRILDANDLAATAHGYTREELLALTVGDLSDPESARQVPERITRLMAGEILTFEVTHRRKDGSEFPVEVSARRIEVEGVVCLLSYDRDITERKEGERRLMESQKENLDLKAALDEHAIVAITDGRGRISYVNDKFCTISKYSRQELLGQDHRVVNSGHHPKAFFAEMWETIARGGVWQGEVKNRAKDGSFYWLATTIVPFRDEQGQPRSYVAIRADITARKRAEEALREAEARWRFALDGAGDGLWDQNVESGAVFYSRRWKEMLGYAEDELDHTPEVWAGLVHPDDLPGARAAEEAHLRGETEAYVVEHRMRCKDGTWKWILARGKVIEWSAPGKPRRMIGTHTDISAQREAEAERRRSEERLMTAVAVSRIVWWEWRVGAGDFRVNACGAPCILGYTAEQMARLNSEGWIAATHPEDRPNVVGSLEAALAGRADGWLCEHRLRAADGSWRWVRNMGRVTARSADGTPQLMVGTTQDVQEHHLDEERIRVTAQRLQVALTASKMGVWRRNLQTGETEWDDRMLEIYGCTHDEVPRDEAGFMGLVLPEDRPVVAAAWAVVRAGREQFEYLFRIRHPDGGICHIRSLGTVACDAQGRPEWVTGIHEDVTREEMRTIALHDLNDRYQLALRSSRFGVWEFDPKTARLQWDEAMYALYGRSHGEFDGSIEAFRGCVLEEDRARVDGAFEEMLAGRPVDYIEFRITRRRDGAIRVVEGNGYLLRDGAGLPMRLVGMNRDITEQKEVEQRRRQLETQLMQSQKLETLGTLAGGIAHDFNNLLTGMLGFIELSLHTLPAQHEAVDYLRHGREGALRARDLVKRLMLFARRAPDTARQPLQMVKLVTETIPLLTATLPASISLQPQFASNVPPVLADAGQMQQVLMNLCVNAAHAIGAHQGTITLDVKAVEVRAGDGLTCAPGAYVRLAVADTGCGMDEATQAKIFDPFFTTKAQGEGTGLGLSIVHGIVQDHGGALRVRSVPGKGTRFEIYLPVSAEQTTSAPPRAADAIVVAGAGRKVLLVDDEASVRALVGAVLRRAGFVVEVCEDGRSAARRFAAAPESFSLAMVDLAMPGRTGVELIADVHAIRVDLPIILMSGDHERYGAVADLPGVVRLEKPFAFEALFAAIAKLLPPDSPPAAK